MLNVTLREAIEVERSHADCYRYLADFSTIEQWDPGVYRAVKRTPGPSGPGSEFDLTLASFGRRIPMRYRLVEARDEQFLRLHGEGEGFDAEDRITLTPAGSARTRIAYEADLRFHKLPALSGALLGPLLNRVGKRAVSGLEVALSASPPVPLAVPTPTLGQRLVLPAARSFTEHGYLAMPNKGLSRFLDDCTVVLTGPTAGIGLAMACELHRLGARLVLVGRQAARLDRARQQILDFSGRSDAIDLVDADLTDRQQLNTAAAKILQRHDRIDVLINNAGAMFSERRETDDGVEMTLAINLLAPYRLTRLLLPRLSASNGRVINVSSGGQYLQPLDIDDLQWKRRPFDGVKAYAQAKRGLVAITRRWVRDHRGVGFHSMHPGWSATPGVAEALPGFNRVLAPWLRDARMGADTAVWLASAAPTQLGSGHFWFDRRPQPLDVVPGTALTEAEVDLIASQLEQWV